jgi:hypothetical protein
MQQKVGQNFKGDFTALQLQLKLGLVGLPVTKLIADNVGVFIRHTLKNTCGQFPTISKS